MFCPVWWKTLCNPTPLVTAYLLLLILGALSRLVGTLFDTKSTTPKFRTVELQEFRRNPSVQPTSSLNEERIESVCEQFPVSRVLGRLLAALSVAVSGIDAAPLII